MAIDDEDDKTTPFIRDGAEPPVKARPAGPEVTDPRVSAPKVIVQTAGSMFGNFTAAKNRKAPPWAVPLFMGCMAFVLSLFVVMWAKSIWEIEQLERPKTSVDLAVAPPPPPPPPPPPG